MDNNNNHHNFDMINQLKQEMDTIGSRINKIGNQSPQGQRYPQQYPQKVTKFPLINLTSNLSDQAIITHLTLQNPNTPNNRIKIQLLGITQSNLETFLIIRHIRHISITQFLDLYISPPVPRLSGKPNNNTLEFITLLAPLSILNITRLGNFLHSKLFTTPFKVIKFNMVGNNLMLCTILPLTRFLLRMNC